MYAVIPYDEYTALLRRAAELEDRRPDEEVTLPHEVVKRSTLGGVSLVRAWREYLGLTQASVAERLGVSQAAYAQTEAAARPRKATVARVAAALRITVEQLDF